MTSIPTDTSTRAPDLDVRVLAPGDPARGVALAMALTGTAHNTSEVRRQVSALVEAASRQGLKLDLVVAASLRERLLAAALAIESPGRSAVVQISLAPDDGPAFRAARSVLQLLLATAEARGVVLLQALVQAEDRDLPDVFRSVGFRYLTELLYLDFSLSGERKTVGTPRDLTLVTYSAQQHATFIAALEDSYVDSLDCPGLTGLRGTEDVLVGHRATGVFDPQGWYVALRAGRPVGVLLTAELPQREALEVVYIGVSHTARGQGVGNYLLAVAHARAQRLQQPTVTLAVDATNVPARHLYERWGYRATHRRRVWIAVRPEQFQP